mgnify:CR=1 FL=1
MIKLAPVLLEARRRGLETVCVVTAQHRETLDMMMDVWELRRETERPEAVDAGTVAMAGVDPDRVYDVVRMLLRGGHVYNRMSKAISPYGDGFASQRIVEILRKSIEILDKDGVIWYNIHNKNKRKGDDECGMKEVSR